MKLKALLAILLVVGFLLIPYPGDAYEGNWLDDYGYRKLISVAGQAGAGTNYQVPLEVHSGVPTEEQTVGGGVTVTLYNGGDTRYAQKLTITNRTITSLSFKILKAGSPTGDVTFTVRGTDDDNVVSGLTKVWGDASALETTLTWEEVEFTTPALVNEEVRICCEFSGGSAMNVVGISVAADVKSGEQASKYAGSWTDLGADCDYKYIYTGGTHNGIAFLSNYCTDFPNDIRFTDDDGVTELRHRIVATGDPTTFKIEIADDLGSNQDFYIYYGKSGAASGVSEFREDWLDYTEVDVGADRVQRTGDPSHHIDFEAHTDEDVYVHSGVIYGVDHFGSDWEHAVNVKPISATNDYTIGCSYVLSNDLDDWYGLRTNSKTAIGVLVGKWTGANARIALYELDAGTEYNDYYEGAYNTWYYLLIRKVGTDLKMGIYSTAALRDAGDATDGDVDNLALTLQADHKFKYVFGADTWNRGFDRTFVMDIEDLLLRFIVDPEPVVGTPGSLETRERSYGYIIG